MWHVAAIDFNDDALLEADKIKNEI